MSKKKLLVTGASGFVGVQFLDNCKADYDIVPVSLQKTPVSSIDFEGVDCVLHLAGIAHRMEKTEDSLYFSVNHELTKELADAAKAAGVTQFVFMSTIKVYGESYERLTLDTECKPTDAYGQSKLFAEQYLQTIESDGFQVAIIRPPLIYGPGVKGNMQRLIEMVEKRKYIPLGKIMNQRSMVSIDNLIRLIRLIIDKKVSGTYLVQDESAISTTELLTEIAKAKSADVRLVAIPGIFRSMIKIFLPHIYVRLFGSLVVDDSLTRSTIDYRPEDSTSAGILKMIRGK